MKIPQLEWLLSSYIHYQYPNKGRMNTCIFCRSTTNNFLREEHLLPESLGGDILLPSGLVCDPCNQYFGKEVEREALASPIFRFHRSSMSIPTKKDKQVQYLSPEFEIHGDKSGMATIRLSPEQAQQLVTEGEILISVEMFEFGALVRLLLKIGLEMAAMLQYDVYLSAFKEARTAARAPRLNMTWPLALGAVKIEDVQESVQDEDEHIIRSRYCQCKIRRDKESNSIFFYFSYGISIFIVPLTVTTNRFIEIVKQYNSSNELYYHLQLMQVGLFTKINTNLMGNNS